jgi:hypothetical protein
MTTSLRYQVWRWFFQAKSQRLGSNEGDACWCCDPLGGFVVVTLSALGLQVKTLDLCGLGDGGACCFMTFLGGVVVELRSS